MEFTDIYKGIKDSFSFALSTKVADFSDVCIDHIIPGSANLKLHNYLTNCKNLGFSIEIICIALATAESELAYQKRTKCSLEVLAHMMASIIKVKFGGKYYATDYKDKTLVVAPMEVDHNMFTSAFTMKTVESKLSTSLLKSPWYQNGLPEEKEKEEKEEEIQNEEKSYPDKYSALREEKEEVSDSEHEPEANPVFSEEDLMIKENSSSTMLQKLNAFYASIEQGFDDLKASCLSLRSDKQIELIDAYIQNISIKAMFMRNMDKMVILDKIQSSIDKIYKLFALKDSNPGLIMRKTGTMLRPHYFTLGEIFAKDCTQVRNYSYFNIEDGPCLHHVFSLAHSYIMWASNFGSKQSLDRNAALISRCYIYNRICDVEEQTLDENGNTISSTTSGKKHLQEAMQELSKYMPIYIAYNIPMSLNFNKFEVRKDVKKPVPSAASPETLMKMFTTMQSQVKTLTLMIKGKSNGKPTSKRQSSPKPKEKPKGKKRNGFKPKNQ